MSDFSLMPVKGCNSGLSKLSPYKKRFFRFVGVELARPDFHHRSVFKQSTAFIILRVPGDLLFMQYAG